jgi:hypothetical protein
MISLASVLTAEEPDSEGKPVVRRQADRPFLETWPPGYEKGSFRVVDNGVLPSAKGIPKLFIMETGR